VLLPARVTALHAVTLGTFTAGRLTRTIDVYAIAALARYKAIVLTVNSDQAESISALHRLSVVVPVYQGEGSLAGMVAELLPFTAPFRTPAGHDAVVAEVVLVYDHGPDDSAKVIRRLAAEYPFVRPLWLSRNFGQHPATLAGMASSGGDWILTMDEDGQHDPAYIGALLDTAIRTGRPLVYAEPTNAPPHGMLRNAASRWAKRLVDLALGSDDARKFQSYRLILGELGRSTAAFAGSGVYLDVALGWMTGEAATCPVRLREETGHSSGYSLRTLLSHFWRLMLSSGTKGLRAVSLLGVAFAVIGFSMAILLTVQRLTSNSVPTGWTSTIVVVLVSTGTVLFSLGVIAEYVGVAVNMAMGKPTYLIVSDPDAGPLGRRPSNR
jgi:hypothetical protein